jgi:branched-subunit amino acid transport protein
MGWDNYLIIVACCIATMVASRVIPVFLLKGRELPERLSEALGYIPPAAFAALVANDLLSPQLFAGDFWHAAIGWIAAIPVVVVAIKTKSLLWCCIVGVVTFGLLLLVPLAVGDQFIGDTAFAGCTSLTNINIPNGVSCYIDDLGWWFIA